MNIKKNYGYCQCNINNNNNKQEVAIVVEQWHWHFEHLTIVPIVPSGTGMMPEPCTRV
jgi:hypothetical protein